MVINIKHFIITIIAIFLSLGIGIFIGVIIDSQHLFIEQQKVIVSQIEEEFDGFRQKNYELMNELNDHKIKNNRRDRFLNAIYDKVIEEDLLDPNIIVINMFNGDDYIEINQALDDIGTKRVAEVRIPRESSEAIQALSNNLKVGYEFETLSNDEVHQMNREKLISRLIKKDCSLLPYSLRESEHVDFRGDIYTSVDYAIIIDDGFMINNKYYREVRKELVNLIKTENIPVMVVEKSDIDSSTVPFYKEFDVSSVDNVDTSIGKLAMIMVLKGKNGHFGEKKTADYLIPEDFLVFE